MKFFRSVLLLILSLGLSMGLFQTAYAAKGDVLDGILKKGEITVGVSLLAPWVMKNKQGKLIGFEVELATILADAMGVEVEFVQKPFGELLPALEKGEIDAIMSGMTMTPKRNLEAAFVGPYVLSGKSILTETCYLTQQTEVTCCL